MQSKNSAASFSAPSEALRSLRTQITELVLKYGHEHRAEAFQLSSAGMSHDYVDGKTATSNGKRLKLVADAVGEIVRGAGVSFDAVGGPTVGADAMAVAVAMEFSTDWFFVRKEPKDHGTQKLIEGAVLKPGTSVLVVDDVATSGRSLIKAIDHLTDMEVDVVMVIPLVDRGESTRSKVAARGIPYEPILTYKDLGIDPV